MTCFITKTKNDVMYSLVFLEVGGKQYHRPTLKELKIAVEFEELREKVMEGFTNRSVG